jgi:hypothetical protein
MVKYKIDTHTYAQNADQSQDLDFHSPVARLQFDLSMAYTSDATPIKYDGHPGAFIDKLLVGEGTRFPVSFLGRDAYYLHWLMNLTKPTETLIVASAGAGTPARARYQFPMPLNIGAFLKPKLSVEWIGDPSQIGGLSTISGSLNGSIIFSENPVPEYSLVRDTTELAISGGDAKVIIPAEGRLSKILIISRDATTHLLENAGLDDVNLRIEGLIEEERQFAILEDEMQQNTDDALEAGVGLIDLSDILPLIGVNSRVTLEVGGTPVDLSFYFIYEGIKQAPAPTAAAKNLAAQPKKKALPTKGGLPSTVVLPRPPAFFRLRSRR